MPKAGILPCMRFAADGPSIPNQLLDARDAGEVVFLCGAGVSIPAGLPDFFRLTVAVADRLGASPSSPTGLLIADEKVRRRAAGAELSEAVPFDRIFSHLSHEYGLAKVETAVIAELQGRRRPLLDHHRALLDLASGPDGRRRLITTNFDRLFQRADRSLQTHLPPHFPAPADATGFDGVVHLHGVLPDRPRRPLDSSLGLILTSADFGRAYLAEAWATRFICDLLEKYVVVLLGYSGSDPPIRYLLEGLAMSGRLIEGRLYAFAPGEPSTVETEWRDRGVVAIPYDGSDHHSRLWTSIGRWAARARDPVAWRKGVAAQAAAAPGEIAPFERGQVAALCGSIEGARVFASADPPPPAEWLCVLDAGLRFAKPGGGIDSRGDIEPVRDPLALYGLDDDPPREAVTNEGTSLRAYDLLSGRPTDERVEPPMAVAGGLARMPLQLNRRLSALAGWICRSLASPTTAWWAASRGGLHPDLCDRISSTLDCHAAGIPNAVRLAWRLILEARVSRPFVYTEGWWGAQSRMGSEGWTTLSIMDFAERCRPRLTVEKPSLSPPTPPESSARLRHIARFDVEYPKLLEDIMVVPDAALVTVVAAVRANVELGAALEASFGEPRRLPTFHAETRPGERHLGDRDAYLVTFSQLFQRLTELDVSRARKEFFSWGDGYVMDVLRLWVLANPRLADARSTGRILRRLPRDVFWDRDCARELLWCLRARWPKLAVVDRRALEARLLEGVAPRYIRESKTQYAQRRARLSAQRLQWMQDAGLKLSRATMSAVERLKQGVPNWNDAIVLGADISTESRSAWVRQESDPAAIIACPISDVIARCDEIAERRGELFVEHDPFAGLINGTPKRALAVLAFEAARRTYPHRYWSRLLQDWPESASSELTKHLAELICVIPDETIRGLNYDTSRWFAKNAVALDQAERRLGLSCFDHILKALGEGDSDSFRSSLGKTSIGGVEQPSNRMGVDYAINAPTGSLAEALINILFARKPKTGGRLPRDFRIRCERLLHATGEGSAHALTILAGQLNGLYMIDPAWTRLALLPRFGPEEPAAEAAWNGFLRWAGNPSLMLFRELRQFFLYAVAASPRWTSRVDEDLGRLLVLALQPSGEGRPLALKEVRGALRAARESVREAALGCLLQLSIDDRCWRYFVVPFFEKGWPLERRFQTPRTTHHLLMFLEGLGERFPAGVRLVLDIIVPMPEVDSFVYRVGSDAQGGRADFLGRFPHDTLRLLAAVVGRTRARSPYQLREVLDRLLRAAPEFATDERFRHLQAISDL